MSAKKSVTPAAEGDTSAPVELDYPQWFMTPPSQWTDQQRQDHAKWIEIELRIMERYTDRAEGRIPHKAKRDEK